MSQAREITSIYTDILESTMDTYSSIINNNMNTVMRTLTSVSIIMMFPTLISSLFGMNLINGMETSQWGFAIALILSVLVCFFWRCSHCLYSINNAFFLLQVFLFKFFLLQECFLTFFFDNSHLSSEFLFLLVW